jgi:peptidoglycan-N-acetylglucosamine deacetylase
VWGASGGRGGRRAALVGGSAVAVWCAPALAPVAPPVAAALAVPRRLPAGAGTVHLTFDDGPHPQATVAVLETLRAFGASATFFLVGEQVERFPALARETAAAGHPLAIHGYRHRCLLRVPPRALADDLRRAVDVVGTAAGPASRRYRPPYGIFSPAGLALVHRLGLAPLLWSRWGHDWRARATPDSVAQEAGRGLSDGDVVLLHDADHYAAAGSWRTTVAALPRILGRIEAAGLVAAPLP